MMRYCVSFGCRNSAGARAITVRSEGKRLKWHCINQKLIARFGADCWRKGNSCFPN